jgi:uncharacterized membrane protein
MSGISMELKKDKNRLFSVDAVRGLIMVLMALDHANYFIAQKHPSGEHWGGSFPSYNEALPFITRLVTHLAPTGFAFLMGVGMVFFASSRRKRGWNEWAITKHFLARGALLILLQFGVVNFAWKLSPIPFPDVYIGVLVALGGGMMIGSFLLRLNKWILLAITVGLFFGMELTHPSPDQWGLIFDNPLGLVLGYSGGDMQLWSNYPVLTWLELVVFGMFFGTWLQEDAKQAYRRGLLLGGLFLAAFILVRAMDGFGNIRPVQGDSWIDFLNVVKYPPSMTYTLLTMGVNLILLWLFSILKEAGRRFVQPLVVYGKVPLFFYLLHLFLYAGLGLWLAPNGTSVLRMYPFWLVGLLILYPLCWWYGSFKDGRKFNSLFRYL